MCKRSLSNLASLITLFFASTYCVSASQLSDPTRPPDAKTAYPSQNSKAVKRWKLSSTLISNGRRNAIINGKLVSLGETIQQARVVAIQPNEVWLVHNKKRFRIKLLARDIKDFSKSAAN